MKCANKNILFKDFNFSIEFVNNTKLKVVLMGNFDEYGYANFNCSLSWSKKKFEPWLKNLNTMFKVMKNNLKASKIIV